MANYLILNSYCKVIFQEKIHIWSGQCNAFIYWIKYFLNLMYMNKTYFPTLHRYNYFFCLWEKYFKKIHPFPLLHKMIYFCKIQNAKSDIRLWLDPPFVLLILICINLLEIYILQLGMNLTRLRKLNNYVENGRRKCHFQVI